MHTPEIHLPPGSFELLSVAELKEKFHPDNDNTHPKGQLPLYAASVEKNGFRFAVVLSRLSGRIVSGHGLVLAGDFAKWESLPVQWQEFASEAQELAFLAAANQLSALSRRDMEKTAQLLEKLRESDFLNASGMAARAITNALARIKTKCRGNALDRPTATKPKASVEEKQAALVLKYNVQPGQLWSVGTHRLLCGKSDDPANIQRLALPEKYLVLFDPPYCAKPGGTWGRVANDDLNAAAFMALLRGMLSPLRGASAVYGWIGWETGPLLAAAMESAGFAVSAKIIWNKMGEAMGGIWRRSYEECYFGSRAQSNGKEKGTAGSPDLISASRSKNEWHTTEKPVLLLKQILETDAITKDRGACPVYDCTMGSASTGVAAVQVGRQFFGMDCEPGPFAAALERMALETGETPVLIE